MKKLLGLLSLLFCLSISYGQTNISIDIYDDVYEFLRISETAGLCTKLANARPYTEKYILKKLDEISSNIEDQYEGEKFNSYYEIVEYYKKTYSHKEGFNPLNLSYRIEGINELFPTSFEFSDGIDVEASAGLYTDSISNSFSYEIINNFNFVGDLGKRTSYRINAFIGATKVPLQYMGTYYIGEWWYDLNKVIKDKDRILPERRIKTFKNNAYLPYSYNKKWDGSVYYLNGGINADGLTGWPFNDSMVFGMTGDLHASLFDNAIEIGLSRQRREWAAMDEGSSLVLNKNARPFFAGDFRINLFNVISLSGITGVLEFPNQFYMNSEAWYNFDQNGNYDSINIVDSYFFQNAFSLAMVDFDFKYFHFDFGSNSIWPKRFELGYAYPFIDKVVYQNNIGDYDNLSLFGNLKLSYPGIGNIWLSGYLDEVNAFSSKLFEQARCMFAFQVGTKASVPILPYTTISFRYTKIEPYCYTHTSLKSTPWYGHYISQSYTNNGSNLGYYLPPNSDEFLLKIDSRPLSNFKIGGQFQLIRHGADFGSGAVQGSSLYSELLFIGREQLTKYFLRDGTYEWTTVFSLNASYDFKSFLVPVKLFINFGYMYQWYTGIIDKPGKKTNYYYLNNDEYKDKNGVVLTVGLKLFAY